MRNKLFIIILGAICSLSFLSTCTTNDNSLFTTTVGGNAYDVMVVGDPAVWSDTAGRHLFAILDEDMPGLPQSEPLFNILFLSTNDFTTIVKPTRNIIFYKIDSLQYTQGKLNFEKDRWARTQAIVNISAPNQEEMIRILNKKKAAMVDFFVDSECERSLLYFNKYRNMDGAKLAKDKLGIQISLPNYIDKSKTGDNFIWFSNGSIDTRMDIIAYRTPYLGEKDFTLERIIEKRDSITKIQIPGPSEGSYMCTETEIIPPVARQIRYKGKKCTEVRGLWRTEGEFMGGPFVSRTFIDSLHNETVTIEAFVYAPEHKKRNKIRQVEAVLHSLEIE